MTRAELGQLLRFAALAIDELEAMRERMFRILESMGDEE
tara:strand:+ start:71 stop:187 length:117 start_codon:yes stop_codon:yes gene_type:complete